MKCWCGCLSRARCRLFAYGPADATVSQNPIISCLIEIQIGFTFLVPAFPGCPGKEAIKRVCVCDWCYYLQFVICGLSVRHLNLCTTS